MNSGSLIPDDDAIAVVDARSEGGATAQVLATRDHDLIRKWASARLAEPATGEATASGPQTIDVKDGGAGIRFSFPGVGRFRSISWDEWFDNFDANDLVFVYERDAAGGPPSNKYRLDSKQALVRSRGLF
jgi:hypothetical protein